MASDSNGKPVVLGDWMKVTEPTETSTFTSIVRVIGLRETTKGTSAVGAYVSLEAEGGVRVRRFTFDPSKAAIVLKAEAQP